MQLPAALRQGVDTALADIPLRDLADAVQILSERYRRGRRDGAPHLSSDLAACAYLATRLPATFAAIAAAFDALAEVRPDFAPRSLLDVGAGPGTAMWAAAERWPIADARLVECSGAIRALGQALAMSAPVARIAWDDADLACGLPSGEKCDLVVVAYVLNELEQDAADRVIDSAWHRSSDTLVVVEPGTPAGWRRMLQVRARVLAAGAHVLAPCPHAGGVRWRSRTGAIFPARSRAAGCTGWQRMPRCRGRKKNSSISPCPGTIRRRGEVRPRRMIQPRGTIRPPCRRGLTARPPA